MKLLTNFAAVLFAVLICTAAVTAPIAATSDNDVLADCIRQSDEEGGGCRPDTQCTAIGGYCVDVAAGQELPGNSACADPNGDDCWCCVTIGGGGGDNG